MPVCVRMCGVLRLSVIVKVTAKQKPSPMNGILIPLNIQSVPVYAIVYTYVVCVHIRIKLRDPKKNIGRWKIGRTWNNNVNLVQCLGYVWLVKEANAENERNEMHVSRTENAVPVICIVDGMICPLFLFLSKSIFGWERLLAWWKKI